MMQRQDFAWEMETWYTVKVRVDVESDSDGRERAAVRGKVLLVGGEAAELGRREALEAAVAAGVTPDLTDRLSAVDLVRVAVVELGGKGGGGRPDMAQGGGASADNADAAIAAAETLLKGK